ncbi:MAG: YggS family pyridoxal phosphate-dependent enzyme [Candidatus Omnitrophica bacterium]|nr:YggS family pyridoxal phosphate-dependent enzyme [Candidatus Omnitrophota bacterium]
MNIVKNLKDCRLKVEAACRRCGRDPGQVILVGVTKYSDAAAVNEAVAAGLKDIAENRIQAANEKFPQVNIAGITKHLIGHLQTNKAKEAVQLFDLIQSVDSIKLLDEIDKRAALAGKVQDILVQVDIAKEEQKFGLPLEEVGAFLARVSSLNNVKLKGVMTMAPLTEDKEVIRSVFRRCHELFETIGQDWSCSDRVRMNHLSMGMSSDYDIAIEEGATMIRLGHAIFG